MAADADAMTFELCTIKARRLLEFAEAETDLAKMARFESLADSWIALGRLVLENKD